MVSLWEFLVYQISFWYTKIFFGRPNFLLVNQKFPETDQKFPEAGQFFFWSTRKNEKKTGQLVDQETDQNHMDGTTVYILTYRAENKERCKQKTEAKIYKLTSVKSLTFKNSLLWCKSENVIFFLNHQN